MNTMARQLCAGDNSTLDLLTILRAEFGTLDAGARDKIIAQLTARVEEQDPTDITLWTSKRQSLHADLHTGGTTLTEDDKISYLFTALADTNFFGTTILDFKKAHPTVSARDPSRTYATLVKALIVPPPPPGGLTMVIFFL